MVKCVSILGSTGSIGRQSLDIIDNLRISVAALTAGTSVERMAQQCRKYLPKLAVMATEEAANALQRKIADLSVEVAFGEEGLLRAATMEQAFASPMPSISESSLTSAIPRSPIFSFA